MELPKVAILGLVNAGKSTLFNRLTESGKALVSKIENTTRDGNYGEVEWRGKKFTIIDAAGFLGSKWLEVKKTDFKRKSEDAPVEAGSQKHLYNFLKEADLILFLTDIRSGVLPLEKEAALFLKRRGWDKKTMMVANKADKPKLIPAAAVFNALNLGEPSVVSAGTGMGLGDLLDDVINRLYPDFKNEKKEKVSRKIKPEKVIDTKEEIIKVCLLGQPNVGKSSLINKILGYDRLIVSHLAHTTREPQDVDFEYLGKKIRLIDTAGINRNIHKVAGLNKDGAEKSLQALKKADVALFMIDASKTLDHQETKLVSEIITRGKSFVILANKSDLIPKAEMKETIEKIWRRLPFATFAPLQFISAKTGTKVNEILGLVIKLYAARQKQLSPSQLDKFLKRAVKLQRPTKGRGKAYPRIRRIEQIGVNPPRFIAFIGVKEDLHDSYLRFLENKIRKDFEIIGTPAQFRAVKSDKRSV